MCTTRRACGSLNTIKRVKETCKKIKEKKSSLTTTAIVIGFNRRVFFPTGARGSVCNGRTIIVVSFLFFFLLPFLPYHPKVCARDKYPLLGSLNTHTCDIRASFCVAPRRLCLRTDPTVFALHYLHVYIRIHLFIYLFIYLFRLITRE